MTAKKMLPLQMECMMLFQSDPLLALSIDELAGKLGIKQEEIQLVLDLLVKQGIIRQSADAPAQLFTYQEPVTVAEFDVNRTKQQTIGDL
ncbi:hypothetical protein [Indiicoccus explosivorum]|uniref:hypothetical protein n=1 Tax=Indiicoccus explosivorum TaxID=1917864 RepID=UPI000B453BC3|nr:hypothetical protein [Indiicoccus explosivorum]